MLAAVSSLTVMGFVLGGLLGLAARYLAVDGDPLADELEEMLPGSQCGQCGYPGCRPAATALAESSAPVTLCTPGGKALAEALAAKLGVNVDLSGMDEPLPRIAHVYEALCIGCTKCLKRCPTDAVVGGPKQIHSVFEEACTGCQVCFDVCPTECIEMRPLRPTLQTWYYSRPAMAA